VFGAQKNFFWLPPPPPPPRLPSPSYFSYRSGNFIAKFSAVWPVCPCLHIKCRILCEHGNTVRITSPLCSVITRHSGPYTVHVLCDNFKLGYLFVPKQITVLVHEMCEIWIFLLYVELNMVIFFCCFENLFIKMSEWLVKKLKLFEWVAKKLK
jgi:hypothetical protein